MASADGAGDGPVTPSTGMTACPLSPIPRQDNPRDNHKPERLNSPREAAVSCWKGCGDLVNSGWFFQLMDQANALFPPKKAPPSAATCSCRSVWHSRLRRVREGAAGEFESGKSIQAIPRWSILPPLHGWTCFPPAGSLPFARASRTSHARPGPAADPALCTDICHGGLRGMEG